MPIIYAPTVRTNRLNVVRDAINAAATPGVLQIGTANMAAVLASIPLTDPVSVSGDVLTLLSAAETEQASGTGTAAAARIRDGDGNDVATGLTVGTSGTDVIVDSTNVTTGQNITVNTATITHPST